MAAYKLSKLANQDVDGIIEYTALNFGERQAVVYYGQIHLAAKTVANFPSMGRPYTTRKGRIFQKYSVGEHALFYQPTEAGILIVRVLHQMMNFDRHLES